MAQSTRPKSKSAAAKRANSRAGQPDRLPRLGAPLDRGREIRLGVVGVLGIVVLVVGVPVALALFVGYPLPRTAPSREWLTQSVTATLIIKILACVVWVLWAHFAVCIIAEWRALRRGRLPGDIPFGGGSQMLARRLVASALLLVGAATAFGNVASSGSSTSPGGTAARTIATASQHGSASGATAMAEHAATAGVQQQPQRTPHATKSYTVAPPAGRHHDSLWDIAHRTLGDGRRYKEIFELNKHRVQPDGRKLINANLIQPGWQLHLPADASGPGVHITAAAPPHTGAPTSGTDAAGANDPAAKVAHGPSTTAGSSAQADAGLDSNIAPPPIADGADNAASTGMLGTLRSGTAPTASANRAGSSLETDLLGGGLILAGVLVALSARRGPYAQASEEEDALAGVSDTELANGLDRALRNLAAGRRAQGRDLPQPIVAWASASDVTLTMAAGDLASPPKPWSASPDGRSWQVSLAAVTEADADEVAPYPALSSVGRSLGYELFVDLEQAPGLIALAGDLDRARQLATAMAVQASTCAWSDGVRVTLVGFGNGTEIAQVAPASIDHVAALADVLGDVEAEDKQVAALRRRLGVDGVLTGRQAHRSAQWRPHLLVLSGPPTPQEAIRLQALIGDGRSQFIAVTVGATPAARWSFVLDPEGQVDLGVLGATATAHHLSHAGIARLTAMATAAAQERRSESVAVQAMTPRDAVLASLAEPTRERPIAASPHAAVTLLGPVSVAARGPLDDARRGLLTSLVVTVSLHPDGVHDAVLRTSLWPRGVSDDVFAATLADATAWLGTDTAGRPALREDGGRWFLGDTVRVDWDELRSLAAGGGAADDELARLTRALALIQGEAFLAPSSDAYRSLAFMRSARDARRVGTAVARRVAELHRGAGRRDAAERALRQGLRLVPVSEVLWRDLLTLVAARGSDAAAAVATEMYETLERLKAWPEAETDALVAQVAPGYRRPDPGAAAPSGPDGSAAASNAGASRSVG